jgi:predicted PurR-regulated permease PerM
MLYYCKEMERVLNHIIPLKQENINKLAAETKRTVRANALGIPLISLIQGATATIGYVIFGVDDWGLWGFLTGLFAFFPVIGTMVIWVPLVVYMYAMGNNWSATWVTLYCAIVVSQVDHLARMTILRKIGNVHPVVTILGILIGLNLFGFIGLIFGPLLVSYIILLFRIYNDEFFDSDIPPEILNNNVGKKAPLPGVVEEKVET